MYMHHIKLTPQRYVREMCVVTLCIAKKVGDITTLELR